MASLQATYPDHFWADPATFFEDGALASVAADFGLMPSLFEPSGLVARASEHRYLLVSDDTGRDETEGLPWLFAMSAQGSVAPEPIVLEGVRELSDLEAITELWRRGSVVSSWLLDLTAAAFHADPALDGFAGRVSDSGEGRWTLHAAVDEGVPVPVLGAALWDRFYSRDRGDVAHKVLSAMRAQFGGHSEVKH